MRLTVSPTMVRQSNFTVIRRVITRIYHDVLQDLESNFKLLHVPSAGTSRSPEGSVM